jgi:hypothetical protein
MATNQFIARFNPRSITKKGRYMYQDLVPDSQAKKAAGAAAIVAGVPGAREVALRDLGSGSEANAPMMPDIYGNQDLDPNSPGPAQITDPNAPVNIASQRESTPEMGMERQETIANQGRGARYDENSIMGLISSLVGNPKANEAFDSTKPVGGANVPYQSAGGLQRFFGNQANQLNLGAQAAQSADWKAEAAATKERQGKIEDYRTQRNIDAEIASGASDKSNAQQLSLLEKTQAAHREELAAQNAFTAAQNDKERAAAMERLKAANANASALQAAGLAATKENAGLQQVFQRDLADKEDATKRFIANNAVHFGSGTMYSRGGTIYDRPITAKGQSEPIVIAGPQAEGPQVNFGGAATPPRSGFSLGEGFNEPPQLPPGGGVRMGGKLPPPPAPAPAMTPPRSANTSPIAEASLLGRFKEAMPSLNLERAPGPGAQSPYLSEGEMAQRVQEQIAYPLRAAAADEAKGEFENPQAAFSVLSRPPMFRLKRPDSMEMQQARKAGDILRQMYTE